MRSGLTVIAALGAAYAALLAVPPAVDGAPFPSRTPLVFAHRGGMNLWPENTLLAFERALDLGVDVLELDVRLSADGELLVFHDATVDRTTEGTGTLADHTVSDLALLDAGYRFTTDGGRSFPFRGRGLHIPTLDEVLGRFPLARVSVELKDARARVGTRLCARVARHDAAKRVLVASFHQEPVDAFRLHCPGIPTAATPGEALRFYAASQLGLPNLARPPAHALFLLERLGPLPIVTQRLVTHARSLGLPVYAWGAMDHDRVRALLDTGVSGITTDRPDEVLALLREE